MIRKLILWYRGWRYPEMMDCENCAGKGTVNFRRAGETCPTCNGTGEMK